MRYQIIFYAMVGVLLMGCQQSNTNTHVPTENIGSLDGRELYQTYCASCHGVKGGGQFPEDPYFPDATGRVGAPPHDSTGHTWHHPDAVLVQITQEGRAMPNVYPMPAFKDQLTEAQIMAILTYIKGWWLPEQIEAQATTSANYTPSAP